jgi:hypothetical protein
MTSGMRDAGPYACPYCRAACEAGTSACPNCGAPVNRPGGFLASDADRDQTISVLTDHFQAGRLTPDEFDDRSGRALRARTQGELTALLADLPPDLPPDRAPVPDPVIDAGGVRPRLRGRTSPVWAVPVVIAIALAIGAGHHQHSLIGLVPAVAVLLFVLRRRAGSGRRPGDSDRRRIGPDLGPGGRDLRRDRRHLRRSDKNGAKYAKSDYHK